MSETIISLGVILSSIICGAAGDALNDKGNKLWGHRLEAAEIGILASSPFIIPPGVSIVSYLFGYGFIRASLFDSIYNVFRGNPIMYNGTSSSWDRFFNKMPIFGRWIWKVLFLGVGLSLLIQDLI